MYKFSSIFKLAFAILFLSQFSCGKLGFSKPISIDPQYSMNEISVETVTFANSVNTASALKIWAKEFNIDKKYGEEILALLSGVNGFIQENKSAINVANSVKGNIITNALLISSSDTNEKLSATVYSPPYSNNPRPAIIFAHGGGFVEGSRMDRSAVRFCQEFASRGYVAISIDYRLANLLTPSWLKAGYTATQDFDAALRYFYSYADNFNIDKDRIILGGISAGAITALHTALIDDYDEIEHRRYKLERMYGTISSNGNSEGQKPEEVWGVINISGAVFDDHIIDEDILILNFYGTEDEIVPSRCDIPFKKYTSHYNGIIDFGLSKFNGYKYISTKLEEMKAFEICGSDRIHQKFLEQNFISSKKINYSGEAHYLFANESGDIQRAGEDIIRETSNYFYNNY